jgi:hypothetical protein
MFDECDAYDAWDKWKHAFIIDTCNAHAPLRKMRLKNRSNTWITHKIVKLMSERDFYHMKATQTKNTELWDSYKFKRNAVKTMIALRKKTIEDVITSHSR